jgi:hypothetical protein
MDFCSDMRGWGVDHRNQLERQWVAYKMPGDKDNSYASGTGICHVMMRVVSLKKQ